MKPLSFVPGGFLVANVLLLQHAVESSVIPDHLVNASYISCDTARTGSKAPECGAKDEGGLFEHNYGNCVRLSQTPFAQETSVEGHNGACMCLWHAGLTNGGDPECDWNVNKTRSFHPKCLLPKEKCSSVDFAQFAAALLTCGGDFFMYLHALVIGIRCVANQSKKEMMNATGTSLVVLLISAFCASCWSICYIIAPFSVYFADFIISYFVAITGITYSIGTLNITLKWREVGSNVKMKKQGANIGRKERNMVVFAEAVVLFTCGVPMFFGLTTISAGMSIFIVVILTTAMLIGAYKLTKMLNDLRTAGQSFAGKAAKKGQASKDDRLKNQVRSIVQVVRMNIMGNTIYVLFTGAYVFYVPSIGPSTFSRVLGIVIISALLFGWSLGLRATIFYCTNLRKKPKKKTGKAKVTASPGSSTASSTATSSALSTNSSSFSSRLPGRSTVDTSSNLSTSSMRDTRSISSSKDTSTGVGTSTGVHTVTATTGSSSAGSTQSSTRISSPST